MKRLLMLAFLSIVWGTTWVAIKYSLQGFPPFLGAAARFSIAIIALLVYGRLRHIPMRMPAGSLPLILLCAFLYFLLDYGFIYWAEQYLYAGVTAIFFSTYPIFTGLLAAFIFRSEPFRPATLLGLLIAFSGIAFIFYDQLVITRFSGIIPFAAGGVLISALAAAAAVLIIKKHLSHIPPLTLSLHQMLWGTAMLLLVGLLRGETAGLHPDVTSLLAVGYMGIVASAIAFVVYYSLLKEMSAVSLSLIIYITPVVGLVTGWLFLGEQIGIRIVSGSLLILAGIAVSQHRGRRAPAH